MRLYIKHPKTVPERQNYSVNISFASFSLPWMLTLSSRHISSFISHQTFPLSLSQPISFHRFILDKTTLPAHPRIWTIASFVGASGILHFRGGSGKAQISFSRIEILAANF